MPYSVEHSNHQPSPERQLSDQLFSAMARKYPVGEVVEFQTERIGYNGKDLQKVPVGRYKVISAFRESMESINSGFNITVHPEGNSNNCITISLSRADLSSTTEV